MFDVEKQTLTSFVDVLNRLSPTDAQNMLADVQHDLPISIPMLQFFLLIFICFSQRNTYNIKVNTLMQAFFNQHGVFQFWLLNWGKPNLSHKENKLPGNLTMQNNSGIICTQKWEI